ncbi:MAG: hypothetical protein ACXVYY_16330 [Oryzihumus sp.]
MAGLVLCLLAGVTTYALLTRPQEAVVPSAPRTDDAGAASHEAAGAALLGRLTTALEHGSRADVLALAAPGQTGPRRELEALLHNVRALRITDLSLRYVDEQAGRLRAADRRRYGGRAWVADVQLGWKMAGTDRHAASLETTLTLLRTRTGAAFVSSRGSYGDHTPLWMLDQLRVRRTARTVVMAAPHAPLRRFAGLADRAVVDVDKVLPRWRGTLVVEVPGSQAQLDQILGSDDHTYDAIAAVTTTVDGSTRPSAPVHVFVNPPVFDPLGRHGSQIVLSHEATHVATGAATATMPTWLLEGFADFVALDHVDLPVSVTASQILGQVRKKGAPDHLPGAHEFDPANTALGASYEAAWLACRLIGQRYGERAMIAFYRQSERDHGTTRAFHDVLGTDQAAFTRAWRAYLRTLAG